ncbi:hypothetical protein PTKIN_Ptkin18bG0040700 [Pterospermum kingtungense]
MEGEKEEEMSSLKRDLVFLIRQFLDEVKYKETVTLEKESQYFFNMRYLEDCITNGEWDDAEKYLSGYTKLEDNPQSMKIFFMIRKQKYLEALEKGDNGKALEILLKELKVFSTYDEELFKETTLLLTLADFRDCEQLSNYGGAKSARAMMLVDLKKLVEGNPLLCDKLQFPTLENSRLQTLIYQSLRWQHQFCKNPRPNPDMKTLFLDHICGPPNDGCAPSPVANTLMGSISKLASFPPVGVYGPFDPAATPAPLTSSLAGWMANPFYVAHQALPAGPIGLSAFSNVVVLIASTEKNSRTPTNYLAIDYQTAEFKKVLKRPRPSGISKEKNNLRVNILLVTYPAQSYAHTLSSSEDLPKNVFSDLKQGSTVKSGTSIGDVTIWEAASRERLVSINFKVWDLGACSMTLQSTVCLWASLANEYTASVNWHQNYPLKTTAFPFMLLAGNVFVSQSSTSWKGVAYSKHILHIYSYHGSDDLRNHLEIEAHVGGVSDIAFSQPNKLLCVITSREDKTIKVWDATSGNNRFTFEGHEAPVYSVCPYQKEDIQFIFSTAIDGKIKGWLYDNTGSRVDYVAPGHSCMTMTYSADGTRLFSCGTNKDGESHIVEWDDSDGTVKRTYHGLGKQSVGIMQFDSTRNQFLAAGDEFQIKFWDVDNVNLLTASPCLRFNKEGILLAVSTNDNGIKILANADGTQLLQSIANRALDTSKAASVAVAKGPTIGTFDASSNRTSVDIADRTAPITAIFGLVVRMIHTNTGGAILALTVNAEHKLWKWKKNEHNLNGKWIPTKSSGIIIDAVFSCDSESIYACFGDASVRILTSATLQLRCRINPGFILVIAAHPSEPDQFAVALNNGGVLVLEPLVGEKWGENVAGPSISSTAGSDQ